MTDSDIAKLAQGFWERKTLAEIESEAVSYKFDVMGFAKALLAAQACTSNPVDSQKTGIVNDKAPCPECKSNYPLHDLDCATGRERGIKNAADNERPAFEKWADSLELDLTRVHAVNVEVYSDCNTDYAWLAWTARAGIAI